MPAIYLIDDAFLGVSSRYADLFDPVPTTGTDTRETGGSQKRDSWQSKTG